MERRNSARLRYATPRQIIWILASSEGRRRRGQTGQSKTEHAPNKSYGAVLTSGRAVRRCAVLLTFTVLDALTSRPMNEHQFALLGQRQHMTSSSLPSVSQPAMYRTRLALSDCGRCCVLGNRLSNSSCYFALALHFFRADDRSRCHGRTERNGSCRVVPCQIRIWPVPVHAI